ncbi:NADPH-dependent 2,4-dienoyl-CoA reductase/sulfur reductase-like enzyme [Streptosporangium becharense]|uniref:NADPH-dependent 2,4-dienoyl-CoA reductase/sulfur reductase-like enzyme n=1 Tax=Streptosporangium becharense TaxID=1816182 RepID=A0A7W9IHP3_9ACTN|nr:FAD-dependent oxidoreductase [Streptosporangium becharense]MBB2914702.1 NADPH-dependent 2,4-dienoyl-CoA reductase/sulfur reductase-like enzyme [Streptosporangium becharense]MBB5820897.1 NADPH-dependent 2,4-dienoyl-CoA reductase/sulfur reductase-like enzyme [Streptosporangium becharense]
MAVDGSSAEFRRHGRAVVVGASLAGLRAAETLRERGFAGSLTVIGDEPYEPYDRPPLSKQVLLGRVPADGTALPRRRALDAHWRLGVAATGLDLAGKRVRLADGEEVGFDRLLIATGTRARPWIREEEAGLDGVFVLRTVDDAARLARRLDAGPRRVLVVGAGFTGSEVASACRERGLEVTVAERGPAPLVGALGGVVGEVAAELHRRHGVDLRCCITVTALGGDAAGRLRRAHLSDGTALDVDVAVIALGALRNTEWLAGSGLAAGPRGIACDAGCRAFDIHGIVTDDIFVAGDVARSPHPLFGYQFLSLEHWGNAVAQAEVAAHNMTSAGPDRRPHLWVPTFWSAQFGVNIKSVGVPTMGTELAVTQGSLTERRFVAAYGCQGRVIAAVAFDQARWLDFYQRLIESAAPFPPDFPTVDRRPGGLRTVPADFPDPALPSHGPTVTLSGYSPSEQRITFTPARA